MNVKLTLLIAFAAIALNACATKRYPIATPISPAEASLMTCENFELELLRTDQVERQINETGEFDGKTILGFLGDFGIGNGMAKSEAQTAIEVRRNTIREAQVTKGCIKPVSIEQKNLNQ
jgi:hypothetical protein